MFNSAAIRNVDDDKTTSNDDGDKMFKIKLASLDEQGYVIKG